MKTITEQIKHGAALAFFASAYADQADECDQSLTGQIMDQLPDEIDPAALHAADTLATQMLIANGLKSPVFDFESLYLRAEELSTEGGDRELTPELFGHYCAMQAMGHGVGLESFGYAVRGHFTVPYVEFSFCSLEKDYFEGGEENPPIVASFRVFEDGDVIALWDEPVGAGLISSYMHVGQHSGAKPELIRDLRPATAEEKAPLLAELQRIGYAVVDADGADE